MDFRSSQREETYGWDNLEPTFPSRPRIEKEYILPTLLVGDMTVAVDYNLHTCVAIPIQSGVGLSFRRL